MIDNLIVVKQLPIIEEQLQQIHAQVADRAAEVLAMPCTEETYKEIKKIRAALSKDFQELETRRKEVKQKIMDPYQQFEAAYKTHVADIFTQTDKLLSQRVSVVEQGIKDGHRTALEEYLAECVGAVNLSFEITLDMLGIKVGMAAPTKKVKEDILNKVNLIACDIATIRGMENSAEILMEYKRTLHLGNAIKAVTDRHDAIAAEEQNAAEPDRTAEITAKVEEAIAEFAAPVEMPAPQENAPGAGRFEVTFRVIADDIEKLRALKQFMEKEGIEYEQL